MADRITPHNISAEESILGGMLLGRRAVRAALDQLNAADFYKPAHGHIFAAIGKLYARGEPADPITVADELDREGLLDVVGGPGVLVTLQASAPAASNVGRYAAIVAELAMLRSMIATAGEIADMAYSLPENVDDALAEATGRLMALQNTRRGGQMITLGDALGMALDDIEAKYEGTVAGVVPTGLDALDSIIGGMTPGSLIIPCARPAIGKTSFALCVAMHVALSAGLPVLVHSMEMSVVEIVKRIISSEVRINGQALRTGKISERDWERLSGAIGALAEAPIWIDDDPDCTIASIRTNVLEINELMGQPPALIVVDYVQLMASGDTDRHHELAGISRQLKRLAAKPIAGSDARSIVMAMSQLKRGVDERKDKRPMLSDMRETSSLEQDADLVLGLYRDEVYHRDSDDAGMAELLVLKHRNGPTGVGKCAYTQQYTRFANIGHVAQTWIGDN